MKQYVCPHCLKKFNYDDFWFKCPIFSEKSLKIHDDKTPGSIYDKIVKVDKNNDSKYCASLRKDMDYPPEAEFPRNAIGDDFANGYFKYQGRVKKDKIPAEARCYYCNGKTNTHICPNPLCRKQINIDEDDNQFIINLAGPKSSGKSDFLGSVLYMIDKRLSKMVDKWTVDFDSCAKEYLKEFITRVESKVNVGTREGERNDPAIITFERTEGKKRKKYSFIFYDVAGEILTNDDEPQDRARKAKKFSRPDYIIFFSDPARMDGVHADLQKSRKQNIKQITRDFLVRNAHLTTREDNEQNVSYIRRIKTFLGDIHYYNEEKSREDAYGKSDTPIGICLTMIDILEDIYTPEQIKAREYFQKSNYLYDRRIGIRDYVEGELESKSDNLIKQFNTWEERNFINYMNNNFGECKYFAISALGVDEENLSAEMTTDFKPRNVLDPLVWFISRVAPEILDVDSDIQNVINDPIPDVFEDSYDTFDDMDSSNNNGDDGVVDAFDELITDDDE